MCLTPARDPYYYYSCCCPKTLRHNAVVLVGSLQKSTNVCDSKCSSATRREVPRAAILVSRQDSPSLMFPLVRFLRTSALYDLGLVWLPEEHPTMSPSECEVHKMTRLSAIVLRQLIKHTSPAATQRTTTINNDTPHTAITSGFHLLRFISLSRAALRQLALLLR